MKKRKIIALLASAATLVALTACSSGTSTSAGSSGASGSQDITILTQAYGVPIVKNLVDKISTASQTAGWSPTVTDTAGDFNKMTSLIQDAATKKVKSVVIVAADPDQISVGLRAAKDAAVPVFFVFGGVEAKDGVTLMVAFDDAAAGDQSAQALISSYHGSGTILMIGSDLVPANRVRADAAKAAFAKAGIPVTDVKQIQTPASSQEDGQNFTSDYLQSNPGGLAGVWSALDESSVGAAQALSRSGDTTTPVVGIGGSDQAIAEIAKGQNFVATVLADQNDIVDQLIKAMTADFNGTPPASPVLSIKGTVVDSTNFAKFQG